MATIDFVFDDARMTRLVRQGQQRSKSRQVKLLSEDDLKQEVITKLLEEMQKTGATSTSVEVSEVQRALDGVIRRLASQDELLDEEAMLAASSAAAGVQFEASESAQVSEQEALLMAGTQLGMAPEMIQASQDPPANKSQASSRGVNREDAYVASSAINYVAQLLSTDHRADIVDEALLVADALFSDTSET